MEKLVCEMPVSLDEFTEGLNAAIGDGGKQLPEWVYQLSGWCELHGLVDEFLASCGTCLSGVSLIPFLNK